MPVPRVAVNPSLGARSRHPSDFVFVLNQFFAEMDQALKETGGHYAQFNGDGLMALYGLDTGLPQGCRQTLAGARTMTRRLAELNRRLGSELPEPLRAGIGLHSGHAIVSSMAPPASPIVSALGDNVNLAAGLEAQSKELGLPWGSRWKP